MKSKTKTLKPPKRYPMFSVRSIPPALIQRFKIAAMLLNVPMNKLLIDVMERKIDEMERDGLMPKAKNPI